MVKDYCYDSTWYALRLRWGDSTESTAQVSTVPQMVVTSLPLMPQQPWPWDSCTDLWLLREVQVWAFVLPHTAHCFDVVGSFDWYCFTSEVDADSLIIDKRHISMISTFSANIKFDRFMDDYNNIWTINHLTKTDINNRMVTRVGSKDIELVSTAADLLKMMQLLNQAAPPLISVDAEGWDISRDGTMSLLALAWNEDVVYVIDVQVCCWKKSWLGSQERFQ